MRYEIDPFLALQEAHRMLITGDGNIRPMEMVSNINPEWENTVLGVTQLIRYYQDYNKLPAEMRQIVERPEEAAE